MWNYLGAVVDAVVVGVVVDIVVVGVVVVVGVGVVVVVDIVVVVVGVGGNGGRRGRQICLGAAEKEPIKSCGKILATVFVDAKQNSFMVWMNVSRKLW